MQQSAKYPHLQHKTQLACVALCCFVLLRFALLEFSERIVRMTTKAGRNADKQTLTVICFLHQPFYMRLGSGGLDSLPLDETLQ